MLIETQAQANSRSILNGRRQCALFSGHPGGGSVFFGSQQGHKTIPCAHRSFDSGIAQQRNRIRSVS